KDAVLTAPNDGVVLTRVAEPGAIVAAGQTIATLSARDVVWVYIFIEEPDLGKVAPGTPVEITTDSSEKTYVGHVGYVSPEAEFTPKTVETPNLRTNLVYRARIVVDAPDLGLRQGAPVDVKIPLRNDSGSVLTEEDKEER
ncbi:MAG: HlyD family efflux transporter periplasmic adaptor subunit, partial [Thermoguttaceae bacterium]|nr:HlyD family efflux transporter periplasmic adaptor subunit [Thermoguttaceae bacterium]